MIKGIRVCDIKKEGKFTSQCLLPGKMTIHLWSYNENTSYIIILSILSILIIILIIDHFFRCSIGAVGEISHFSSCSCWSETQN